MQYKNNIVERLGGIRQYEMTALHMGESMMKDPDLKRFFGSAAADDLCALQMSVLDLALGDMDNGTRNFLLNRATLRHYRLFQEGLNGTHFALIQNHLEAALRESWADADVIDGVLALFKPLQESFYMKGGQNALFSAATSNVEGMFFPIQ